MHSSKVRAKSSDLPDRNRKLLNSTITKCYENITCKTVTNLCTSFCGRGDGGAITQVLQCKKTVPYVDIFIVEIVPVVLLGPV